MLCHNISKIFAAYPELRQKNFRKILPTFGNCSGWLSCYRRSI